MNNFFSNFLVISSWQTLVVLAALAVSFGIIFTLKKKGVSFSLRMIVGLVFGLLLGICLQYIASTQNLLQSADSQIVWISEVKAWLNFFGAAFIGFIKMLVLPIIGITIIKVIMDIDKNIKISTLLSLSLFWLLFSTGVAAAIGLGFGMAFDIGANMNAFSGEREIREVKNIIEILLGLIPTNIIDSMIKNNIIAIVIFMAFVGFGAKSLSALEQQRENFEILQRLINALHAIIMKIADLVISFMPYAIVAMMGEVLLKNGYDALKAAGGFIAIIYACMFVMFALHLIFVALLGLNPFVFAKKSLSVWLFAFSSRSSVATLPLTLSTLQNKLGVSGSVANFVATIGTTIGLNGCAGYFPALAAVFIAHSVGVEINFTFGIMIILVAIIGSLGIAGIPGSATMAASIMLTAIGFGEHFALLSIVFAIDPIIDMARTTSNVSGAMMASVCTDRGLKTLNTEVYKS